MTIYNIYGLVETGKSFLATVLRDTKGYLIIQNASKKDLEKQIKKKKQGKVALISEKKIEGCHRYIHLYSEEK